MYTAVSNYNFQLLEMEQLHSSRKITVPGMIFALVKTIPIYCGTLYAVQAAD